jgi:hypothetical protein
LSSAGGFLQRAERFVNVVATRFDQMAGAQLRVGAREFRRDLLFRFLLLQRGIDFATQIDVGLLHRQIRLQFVEGRCCRRRLARAQFLARRGEFFADEFLHALLRHRIVASQRACLAEQRIRAALAERAAGLARRFGLARSAARRAASTALPAAAA